MTTNHTPSAEEVCNKCEKILPVTDFHKCPKQGRSKQCKKCRCEQNRKRYKSKKEKILKQQRKRYQSKRESILERHRRYCQTEEGKKSRREISKRARERNPDRQRVYARVKYAIQTGRLKREPCKCGEESVEAHHEDYSYPLDVAWLCKKCHAALHHSHLTHV